VKTRLRPAVVLAGAALVGAPIAAALVLRPGSGTSAAATTAANPVPTAAPSGPRFPAPPSGAVVYSRQFGSDDLALGVVPRRGSVLAQASVVGPQGQGVPGLTVAFVVQGATKPATACGAGCYRATFATKGRPAGVDVVVRGGHATHWHVALPATWPPRDGSALLVTARAVWQSLRSLSYTESLASGPGYVARSTWQIQAPDRVAYQVKGGWSSVVVGTQRWDRAPNSRHWVESAQSRLTQPVPFWQTVTDAHILGVATVQGRSTWLVSFFDPQTPGWFRVALDRKTLRTLDTRMIATAHFMHDTYGSFNAVPAITPPR
jgi:hypothetical protein